mmetsp:Transcript_40751/g.65465  ORF Transcript_40751/g.65465 Transcript_40751/m.65465 type:complete len:214 (-) Transcript_40751:371-1012(-)
MMRATTGMNIRSELVFVVVLSQHPSNHFIARHPNSHIFSIRIHHTFLHNHFCVGLKEDGHSQQLVQFLLRMHQKHAVSSTRSNDLQYQRQFQSVRLQYLFAVDILVLFLMLCIHQHCMRYFNLIGCQYRVRQELVGAILDGERAINHGNTQILQNPIKRQFPKTRRRTSSGNGKQRQFIVERHVVSVGGVVISVFEDLLLFLCTVTRFLQIFR